PRRRRVLECRSSGDVLKLCWSTETTRLGGFWSAAPSVCTRRFGCFESPRRKRRVHTHGAALQICSSLSLRSLSYVCNDQHTLGHYRSPPLLVSGLPPKFAMVRKARFM